MLVYFFLTNTGFYYFLCCCQESWADFRAQDSNLLVLWSYNCLCHVFWIAGLGFVLCFWCKYYLSELLCYWIDCIFDHRRLFTCFSFKLDSDIYVYMYTIIYTFRVSDFLMGDVDSSPGLGIAQKNRSRVRHYLPFPSLHSFHISFLKLCFDGDSFQRGALKAAILPRPQVKKPQRLAFCI